MRCAQAAELDEVYSRPSVAQHTWLPPQEGDHYPDQITSPFRGREKSRPFCFVDHRRGVSSHRDLESRMDNNSQRAACVLHARSYRTAQQITVDPSAPSRFRLNGEGLTHWRLAFLVLYRIEYLPNGFLTS